MFVVILKYNSMLISRATIENEEALCLNTYILEGIEEEKCVYIYSDILGGAARIRRDPGCNNPNEKNRRRLGQLTPFLSDLVSPIDS